MTEETVMTIDYRERYHDEVVTQSDESLIFEMRDDLLTAIDELRSTITALYDHTEDGANALERAHERITELEVKLQQFMDYTGGRENLIVQLEFQLTAALATIERATWCEQCNLPAEYCRENHGQLYAEGCTP